MRIKTLMVIIIVLSGLICGQLAAEEVVGESIFPLIESPHPYPQAEGKKALVWRQVVQHPGAVWIKLHFSNFRLNKGDFVNLIDDSGGIVEQITSKDLTGKINSKVNVQKNSNHTVDFWALAVSGDRVRIELYRKSKKPTGWGFEIDEVGIGYRPLIDMGLGPVHDHFKKTDLEPFSLVQNNISEYMPQESFDGEFSGIMLYKKENFWYTNIGKLINSSKNHFLPHKDCIDSPDVVNTLEVRFYSSCRNRDNGLLSYKGFYGHEIIDNNLSGKCGLLSLKWNDKMIDYFPKDGHSIHDSRLSRLYGICDCLCPEWIWKGFWSILKWIFCHCCGCSA